MLGERRQIRVVIDEHWHPQPLGHHVPKCNIRERQVHRPHGDSRAMVDQRRDPEPDRRHLVPGGAACFFDRVDCDVEKRRLVETLQRALGAVVDLQIGSHRPREQLCPAHVDADDTHW